MANVATLQQANPGMGTVTRRPQTTTPAAGNNIPFIRQSRRSENQGFQVSGQAFGGLITMPLKAVGGYLRGFFLTVTASGGAGASTYTADGAAACISSILLRDSLGQPILQYDGFGARLVDMYSGQFGMAGFQDPILLPSFTAPTSGGNFTIRYWLPLEFDSSAYCSLASMNASAPPSLQIQLAPSSAVWSSVPATTVPTMTVTVNQLFWAAPIGAPDLGPPDVGSSCQWSQAISAQGVASGANQRITLPRVGAYIGTLIGVCRDSTGARVDAWPLNDLTLYVDSVPVIIRTESEHYDELFQKFGLGKTTGVIAFSFRDAVQQLVGLADTHDNLLQTTPATLLEVGGTWQTITNAPAQITWYTQELYPVSGVPYNHLTQ